MSYIHIFLFFLSTLLVNFLTAEIHIVYHVAILNNWKEIVEEQMTLLQNSGLLDAAEKLIVNYVGDENKEINSILEKSLYAHKIELIHASEDISVCEFPSIAKTKEVASKYPQSKILYFHSKGVSHFGKSTEQAVSYWRKYMEYFLIESWKLCVDALDSADVCGVEWKNRPPHFSGNFWWATANYINTLPELNQPYSFKRRLACEFFIGKGMNPKFKELHHSPFKNLYRVEYSADQWRPTD